MVITLLNSKLNHKACSDHVWSFSATDFHLVCLKNPPLDDAFIQDDTRLIEQNHVIKMFTFIQIRIQIYTPVSKFHNIL